MIICAGFHLKKDKELKKALTNDENKYRTHSYETGGNISAGVICDVIC